MTIARAVVIISAIVYFGIGTAFVVAPKEIAARASIELTNDTATTELRTVYGGLELGIAAFLFWAAARTPFVQAGLWLVVTSMGGLAGIRTIFLIVDGPHDPIMYPLLAAELMGLLAGIAGLVALKRDPSQNDS